MRRDIPGQPGSPGLSNVPLSVLAAVGMAFCWPLLRRTYPGLLLAGLGDARLGETFFFVAEFVVLGLLLLASRLAVRKPLGEKPFRRASVVAACGFALSGVGLFSASFGSAEPVACVVGATAFALAVPLVFALWFSTLVQAGPRVALSALSVSFVLSFVVSLLSLLEPPLRDVTLLLAPLASVGLWAWARAGGAAGAAAGPEVGGAPAKRRALFPRELIWLLALFILVGGVLRGLSSPAGVTFAPADDMAGILFRNLISLVIAGVLAFGAYASAYSLRGSLVATIGTCVLFMAGLCMVGMGGEAWVAQGLDLVAMARNCLEFLLAVALVGNAVTAGRGLAVSLTARFLAPVYGSQLVSYAVMPAFMEVLGLEGDYGSVLVLGSALLLALGMLGAMGIMLVRLTGDGEAVPASPEAQVSAEVGIPVEAQASADVPIPTGAADGADALEHAGSLAVVGGGGSSIAERLGRLQAPLGLTDREVEIGCLLAQGHSYKKVAEVLVISLSTVQSHTRNLYRKCGVNSRQGLIDMLAEMDRLA